MSSPFPFSSPTQVSHFISGSPPNTVERDNGGGPDHTATSFGSPAPSPYFSPYSSSFQSPASNNPFIGVNSPNTFGHSLPINLPVQESYYGGGTPTQSPQLYSHPSMADSPRMGFHASPWSPTTSWASSMLPAGMNNSWLGLAGMGFANQSRPKLTTTLWEDENTVCYQIDAKGICVARRQDNDMVNGTKLLNVTGMSRGKRDGILKNEKGRVVVKVGAMHLKGVWITFQRAKALAAQFKIADILYPLFAEDPSPFQYNPHCPPNAGSPQMPNVSNAHQYTNNLSSPSLPPKPQVAYDGGMTHLSMNSPHLYASQGHPPMGSSPNMNNELETPPAHTTTGENEDSASAHNSPNVPPGSYTKILGTEFVPPAEPSSRGYEATGKGQPNFRKREYDDLEEGCQAPNYTNGTFGRTTANPHGRNFATFPSPLTLSPSSLPSPSITQSNSNFHCDMPSSMSKRIKLPDSDQFRQQEANPNSNKGQDGYLGSFHGNRQSHDRPVTTPSLNQESLGLLLETLSPPESETENLYESTGSQYNPNGYDNDTSSGSQRISLPQTVKQSQS
ncbi:hypothetical protein K7432_012176 [Basidiobolus ranarum]|uniref:HTH APSES-type domain-containing protein n=1 Tax=Basidiobolus ranarum TaxID=34480 RepID=A0ABR2WL88_9FUNG